MENGWLLPIGRDLVSLTHFNRVHRVVTNARLASRSNLGVAAKVRILTTDEVCTSYFCAFTLSKADGIGEGWQENRIALLTSELV